MENLTFADLGLSQAMLKALEKKGYGYPTTIQAEAIPHFMQWKDVIAKAPTGTGKTFAFGIPMIESRRPSGLRKTIQAHNSLAHRTTWLRSDLENGSNV